MSVKRIVRALGIVTVVLILTGTVGASTLARPFSRVVAVQGQADDGPLHLEAAISNQTLIGTLTVFSKDDRPWTDTRGLAYLLDSAGQRLVVIPLQPLAPGEFRLIVPLSRLTAPGYLDIHLPGEARSVSRAVYRVDPAGPALTQVDGLPMEHARNGPLAVQATGGPDMFGYTWNDAVTYGWIDTTGGTAVTMRDDDYVGPLSIGFTFNFYGKNYAQFYIDSNGFLSFADNTQSYYSYSKYNLSSPARPNNVVAPFWEDFDPSQGGTIRYQTTGSSPNRTLVVEWQNVPSWGTSNLQSFQMVLYEGSNQIRFQYRNTRSGTRGDLRAASVGIENDDGAIGLTYPYTIPLNVNRAILFSYTQPPYNVFLTPERQGNSGAAGLSAAFHVKVKNLGSSADSYTMSRPAYTGSDWAVSFYQSDGVTPLSVNSTGSIAAGDQKDIVVKVSVPGGASLGSGTRATVRAQGSGGVQSTATVDVMLTPSFYQAYTDNDSGDGTEDSENYIDPIVNGASYTQRQTTDKDNSDYAGVASTPDGNAVTVWNTDYRNSNSKNVSEIQYAIVNPSGGFVRSITRLTNNSSATQKTFDFSPAVAVAPNGNILIDWALQVDSNGDGVLDRYNAWYTILTSGGTPVKAPTALTFNTSDYPRDYPPSAVALTGTNNFLLTWEHAASSSGPVDIYYTVLTSSGAVVKSAAPLTSGGVNVTPRAASFPNGKAAIVWTSYNSYGNGEIYYAVLNADGSSPSLLTPITTNGSSAYSMYADAAALSDGQLAVAWTQATSDLQIQYTVVPGGGPTPTATATPTPTRTPTPTPTPTGGPGCVTIVSEDFEGSFPGTTWRVFDNNGTTNGEYYWAKKNCKAYAGSNSGWAVGGGANGAALACGSNYPNNAQSWMVYGPFSLVGATAADLRFKLWLNSELNYDGVCQMASINGTNFSGGCTTGNTQGWIDSVLDLTSAGSLGNLTGQPNVWIALMLSSNSSNNNPEGAYVDNIVLRKCSTSGGTSTPTPTPTRTPTPTNTPTPTPTTPTPGQGISGIVTSNGSGVGGLTVSLIRGSGGSESLYLTTATQANGSYLFTGAADLTSGQYYYVRYWNSASGGNTANPAYVAYWFGPTLNSYTAGTNASGGNWDIANVSLVSPSNGSILALPVTFQWTPRGITGDNYRWSLFDLGTGNDKCWGPYQTGGSFVVDSSGVSPCGIVYGTQYGWFVYVVAGNAWTYGYGASYYYGTITFSDGAAEQQGGASEDDLLDTLPLNSLIKPFKRSAGPGPMTRQAQSFQPADASFKSESPQVSLAPPDYKIMKVNATSAQRTPSVQRASTNVRIQSPAAPQVIYTVPNAINDWNVHVSLAVDSADNLILTWLDSTWYDPFYDNWYAGPRASYLFYALGTKTGTILTPATILQRTRRSYLWSSWNGYGNAYMPPQAAQGPVKVYLPLVLRNYPPPPPAPPVKNGGFEETPDLKDWTPVGSGQLAPKVVSAPTHNNSTRAAVLGYSDAPCQGEPHGDSSLSQSIQVPSSGSPRLSLFYRIKTYDRLVGDKYDWFAVYINGALVLQTGRTSPTTITGCAASAYDTGWQQFTYDLSAYQGQTIEIRLVNHTSDQYYNTWTYVDDVSVN
jgi:hypothetical protein